MKTLTMILLCFSIDAKNLTKKIVVTKDAFINMTAVIDMRWKTRQMTISNVAISSQSMVWFNDRHPNFGYIAFAMGFLSVGRSLIISLLSSKEISDFWKQGIYPCWTLSSHSPCKDYTTWVIRARLVELRLIYINEIINFNETT